MENYHMPIKTVRFSFAVPMTALLSLLATTPGGLQIDVYGNDPKPARRPRALGADVPLLEAPKREPGGPTGTEALVAYFVKHKDRAVPLPELYAMFIAMGLKKNSVSPQLVSLMKRGLVRRPSQGCYSITAKGLRMLRHD
jgi:hypothetical protein